MYFREFSSLSNLHYEFKVTLYVPSELIGLEDLFI